MQDEDRAMTTKFPAPPFPKQHQPMPGRTGQMQPRPDHGEDSYKGAGRLSGKRAVIMGGDSGIGRAVALAYAREGADVLISYLDEHDDARWVDTADVPWAFMWPGQMGAIDEILRCIVPADSNSREHQRVV